MNNRKTGSRYEEAAAVYMEEKGMHIVCRNFRTRTGEIDIVAIDRGVLVFAEVKYRRDDSRGTALEAISSAKQKQVRSVARQFLFSHKEYTGHPIRFDAVGITGDQFQYIQNAF